MPNEKFNPDDVRKIIAERLGKDISLVTDNANLETDLGADSLDAIEIIMTLEERYKLNIPDQDASKIQAVSDAIDYIRSNYKPNQ